MSILIRTIISILAALPFVFPFCAAAQEPAPPQEKEALLINITLPITAKNQPGILKALDEAGKEAERNPNLSTLIIEFDVPPGQGEFGRGSQFGLCHELAKEIKFGPKFSKLDTVAFFPKSVQGHAILLGLACKERIMAESAEIGNAGSDETFITESQRNAYEVDFLSGGIVTAIARKLLEADSELLEVDTENGTRWTDRAGLETLRREETLTSEPEVILAAGTPGIFPAALAHRIGLVKSFADDRVQLARRLGLSPENIRQLSSSYGRAGRLEIVGSMTPGKASEYQRRIQDILDTGVDAEGARIGFLCVYINSDGGSLEGSLQLAGFISSIDRDQLRTVAYVDREALSDSALIALACDELAVAPDALIGGPGAREFSREEIELAKQSISGNLFKSANGRLRSWSIPAAMIDRNLIVYEMRNKNDPNRIEYYCDAEVPEGEKDQWEKRDTVASAGSQFQLKGTDAKKYRLADTLVKDMREFAGHYRIEEDMITIEPNWVERFAMLLAKPWLSMILLLVAFYAFWAEIKTPGIGVGAFIAIVCFGLFFWSRFLGGTAGWLEVTLFSTGVILVVLEIFVVPGFGIFGIGGGAAIILSLVFASQTFIIPHNAYQVYKFRDSLMILAVSSVGMVAVGMAAAKMLHKVNEKTDNSEIEESEKLADYSHLLGKSGKTITPLVPSGKAVFEGELVSVVSADSLMIETETLVEVVEIRGYLIAVRERNK